MKTQKELGAACGAILEFLQGQRDIADAMVFVSANEHNICRFNYTSRIPSNGVEEPKAVQDYGIGITIVLSDGRSGSGSAESSLSIAGAEEALAKARLSAVKDPEFYGLPKPEFGDRTLGVYHDPALMELPDKDFVTAAWGVLRNALSVFETHPDILCRIDPEKLADLKLIIGGDVQLIREAMAIASFRMPETQCDTSSMTVASITAMAEARNAKGSGFFAGNSLDDLMTGARKAAAHAVNSAIATMSGERIPSGDYTVVFGPQAVAELVKLVVAGLTAGAIYAEQSPFQGEFLKPIASPLLSIYDDGANPKFMGAKAITCEGLPTGRTNLIVGGICAGLLSSHYGYQRMLRDPEGKRKLGADPNEHRRALWPRNGFRFGRGAGRQFSSEPSCSGSNVIVTSSQKEPLEKILARVQNGVYIGRMWYVYPINGLRAGDITGTVTADSYLIKNGALSSPLAPNAVRINDNLKTLLLKIAGVSDRLRPVNLWGADEAMYAPDILVDGVHLDAIAEFTEMKTE